ncbi:MAG: T9SS type A sorting domain-containing protein, partial [Bacteroidota bacterium]
GGYSYLLTDVANNILGISASPIFNLENTGPGIVRIYGLSFTNELTGLVTGGNLADLAGCHDLTNPVEVLRNTGEGCLPECIVNGGNLSVSGGGDQIAFCVGDEEADDFAVEIEFQVGQNFLYLVTDTAGVIEEVTANPNFAFVGAEPGISLIRGLSFGNDLNGAAVGANIAGLFGCYALSNPVKVIRRPAIACQVEVRPDVIITELNFFGAVELTNRSDAPFDVGALYLGNDADMRPVSSFSLGCGTLMTQPGDVVTVFIGSLFERTGGELALATSDAPAVPTELLSYLAWGGNDGTRHTDEMAHEAGFWAMDTELATPSVLSSIQLISDVGSREYALRSPTPCASTGITTGIFSPRAAADVLEAYPNPFTSELMIRVQGLRGQHTDVSLFDATGRRVISRTIHVRGGRFRLRTGQLPAGAYWLRLASGDGVSTAKVIRR